MGRFVLFVGAFLSAGVLAATALAATASDTARLKPGEPQQAIVNVHSVFASIESACFEFTFAADDGLDPGESLRITPTRWLKDDPFDRGPGFENVTAGTQYARTLCPTNATGDSSDRLLDELLDGRERLTLNADQGSVSVTSLEVTIVGTQ